MALGLGFRFLVLAVWLAASCSSSLAQTLHDVLNEHKIPVGPAPIQNLSQRITSFAVLDDETNFLIAYYIDDGSGLLSPPLYMARFVKKDQSWKINALRKVEASFKTFQVPCLGSAMRIVPTKRFFFVQTHLNPSAGCLVILSENLAVKKALWGSYLAVFRSGLLVFNRSQIHFAPTHPMEIAVYDLQRDVESNLYPPSADSFRAAYIEKLRAAKPSEDWCREHNSHCDPQQFESNLFSAVVINEEMQALAFVARFTPVGLISREEAELPSEWVQTVAYVFRFHQGVIRHREFRSTEMKERFGADSLDDLLKPAILKQLFASPKP